MGKARSALKLYCNALGRLRHSKGFGIHSPFAFSFVLRVLREKCAYYAYADIAARRRLAQKLIAPGLKGSDSPRIISLKNARMLFRIVCYFNPKNIVQIGTSYGVSTSAALDVSTSSRLIIYRGSDAYNDIFDAVTAKFAGRISEAASVDDAFRRYFDVNRDGRDFLMVNSLDGDRAVEDCTRHASRLLDREGVIVARNLLSDERVVQFVRNVTESLTYGMTFTNGRLIIIVGYKHLPRQRFNLWF